MHETKLLAVLIASMSHEELQDAFIAEVSISREPLLVDAVYQGIGKHIANSLDVDHDEVSSGELPGEMA